MEKPHDRLFRAVFLRPWAAAHWLRALLPAAVATVADWSALACADSSLLTGSVGLRHLDGLFELRGAAGETLLVVIVEHQSKYEPRVLLGLHEATAALWRRAGRDEKAKTRGRTTIPLVVPVVLHTGPRPWGPVRDIDGLLSPGLREACRDTPWLLPHQPLRAAHE